VAFPRIFKPTPIDTNPAHIQPVPAGGTASAGGTADPGAAAAPDHVHAGPAIPAPQRPTGLAPALNTAITPGAGQWGLLVSGNSGTNSFGLVELSNGKVVLWDACTNIGAAVAGVLVYDPVADTWTQQAVSNFAGGAWGIFGTPGGNMGPQYWDDGAGKLWVFAASGAGANHFGYLDYHAWAWVAAPVAGLPAQWPYCMWAVGSTLYVLFEPHNALTLWTYDTTQGTGGSWVQVTGMAGAPNFNTFQAAAVYYPATGLAYIIEAAAGNGGNNAHTYNPATKAWGSAGFANTPVNAPDGTTPGGYPGRIILHGNKAVVWYYFTSGGGRAAVVNLDTQAWVDSSVVGTAASAALGITAFDAFTAADLGNGSLLCVEYTGGSQDVNSNYNLLLCRLDWVGNRWSRYGSTASVGGSLVAASGVSPGNSGLAGQPCTIFTGTGVPAAGLGANGDFFFRQDGAAGTCVYQKRAGAWVATAA